MAIELPYAQEEHDSRVLCGDPVACGYEWIKRYVDNLNDRISSDSESEDYGHSELTVEEVIETAMSHLDDGSRWGGDYIVKGGVFEGTSTDPTFWDKLADFKQIEIPQDKRNNFFSCSC